MYNREHRGEARRKERGRGGREHEGRGDARLVNGPVNKNPFPARGAAAPYSLAPTWLCGPTERLPWHSRSPPADGSFALHNVDVLTLPLECSLSPCLPVSAIPLGRRPHPSDSIYKSLLWAGTLTTFQAGCLCARLPFPAVHKPGGQGSPSPQLCH